MKNGFSGGVITPTTAQAWQATFLCTCSRAFTLLLVLSDQKKFTPLEACVSGTMDVKCLMCYWAHSIIARIQRTLLLTSPYVATLLTAPAALPI